MSRKTIVIIFILVVILILIAFLFNRNEVPEEKSNKPNNFDTDAEIITVVSVEQKDEYISYDGGTTWENNEEPSFYMNLEKGKYPIDTKNIIGHLYNNYSDRSVHHGYEYFLYKWSGIEFKQVEFPPDMAFPDEGLMVNPGDVKELNFEIYRFDLDEGRYLLEKKVRISEQDSPDDMEEYIITSEFYLE